MTNYYFDAAGFYVGSAMAQPGTLPPANAVRIPPPERDGWAARINSGRSMWTLVPVECRHAPPEAPVLPIKLVGVSQSGKAHRPSCPYIDPDRVQWYPIPVAATLLPAPEPCRHCRPDLDPISGATS